MSNDKWKFGERDAWIILPLIVLVIALVVFRLANRLTRETNNSVWSIETLTALLPWLGVSAAIVVAVVLLTLLQRRRQKQSSKDHVEKVER